MKLITRYITIVAGALLLLLAAPSCSRRSTLSDTELAQVFHDAYLANAYTSSEGIRLDSLRLYEPIFNKYGYTTEDVQYSIGNFSLRKSARLSDVVERAISMLESRGRELDLEVAILDTVDNIAKRRTIQQIYSDTLRSYRSRSDSASMMIVIEPIKPGSYRIEFDYLIDTLDNTVRSYSSKSWYEVDRDPDKPIIDEKGRDVRDLMDEEDIEELRKPRVMRQSNTSLRKRSVEHYSNTINVDDNASRLIFSLATIVHDDKREHSATFKRIKIERLLDAESAQDSLFRSLAYVNIFDDELLFPEP
ncbi:MAG: DUF4296 domain-containing protein [Rikenellaceae bacterium]